VNTALAIGGAIASLAAVAAVVYGRIRRVKPKVMGAWTQKLLLIECAEPSILPNLVEAIKLWDSLQWSMVLIQTIPGVIQVKTDPTLEDLGLLGRTFTQVEKDTGRILSATIYVVPNASVTTIAHEIGHALGFDHTQITGHLMHATKPSINDLRGLERKT